MSDTVTLEAFYKTLVGLDWYYQMSDDQSVWRRGRQSMARAQAAAQTSEAHQKMFDDYQRWVWLPPEEREREPRPYWRSYTDG